MSASGCVSGCVCASLCPQVSLVLCPWVSLSPYSPYRLPSCPVSLSPSLFLSPWLRFPLSLHPSPSVPLCISVCLSLHSSGCCPSPSFSGHSEPLLGGSRLESSLDYLRCYHLLISIFIITSKQQAPSPDPPVCSGQPAPCSCWADGWRLPVSIHQASTRISFGDCRLQCYNHSNIRITT